ncbi:DUF5336 domain-containing protein [Mycobacterium deserti]|uniref:DUF5336 domain-containing protein n=1 Tax=Mycobacterium deserti TaxID=2978347 RepID=A0ABT2MBN8_9MYCO|nr:DUF5336 domain-containing protein [Mycobacterium deserti]MCT7659684.1 DUF5336 domain-containing protein [Mycobacterium deserti]
MYSHQTGPAPGRPTAEDRLPKVLLNVVVALGVVAYGLSFGPMINGSGASGWNVRFAVLAALCALFGLLPRQKPLPLVIAVLAAMGFLDALSSAFTSDTYAETLGISTLAEPGWPMTAIVVTNALQMAAAVAALLTSPETATTATAGYEAYVDYYNQAVRTYYSQQAQPVPHEGSQYSSGYGQSYADAQATSGAQRTHRPSQYADYTELDYRGSRGSAAPEHNSGGTAAGGSTGLPSFGQAPTHADPNRRRDTGEPPPTAVP